MLSPDDHTSSNIANEIAPPSQPRQSFETSGLGFTMAASTSVLAASLLTLGLLAWYLGITPGSVFARENNVLFNADTNFFWQLLTDPKHWSQRLLAHPLIAQFWGRVGAGLAGILKFAWSADDARFLAATGMVCAVAAAGFACLAACASRLNPKRWNLLLLAPVCLLFTSNTIIVQPDHFGLSFGLLAAATLLLLPGVGGATRAALLIVAGILVGGTTITNGLYPALVAAIVYRDHLTWANAKRLRYGILAVATMSALVLVSTALRQPTPILSKISETGGSLVKYYLRGQVINDPLGAIRYAGSGLLYPAVGPRLNLWASPFFPEEPPTSSYESSHLSDYPPLSAVAACAWVALLAASSWVLVRSPDLRNFSLALFGWIAFNLLFHNLWGDEFFLFTPHWSWALMLIVLLGSRGLPTWSVALAAALIAPGQLATLDAIRRFLPG